MIHGGVGLLNIVFSQPQRRQTGQEAEQVFIFLCGTTVRTEPPLSATLQSLKTSAVHYYGARCYGSACFCANGYHRCYRADGQCLAAHVDGFQVVYINCSAMFPFFPGQPYLLNIQGQHILFRQLNVSICTGLIVHKLRGKYL